MQRQKQSFFQILKKMKIDHSNRKIALGGGGVKSQPAQTLGSMDRLARIKASAIEAGSRYRRWKS